MEAVEQEVRQEESPAAQGAAAQAAPAQGQPSPPARQTEPALSLIHI